MSVGRFGKSGAEISGLFEASFALLTAAGPHGSRFLLALFVRLLKQATRKGRKEQSNEQAGGRGGGQRGGGFRPRAAPYLDAITSLVPCSQSGQGSAASSVSE